MRLAAALMFSLASCTAFAAGFDNPQVLEGGCTPKSHIAEGRFGIDRTMNQSPFTCDAVAITPIDGNPRHVLLTFSASKSDSQPRIGYAGVMDEDEVIKVDRAYLQAGAATPTDDGACKIFRAVGRISNIVCVAKIEQDGRRTVPLVAFKR